MLHNLTNEVHPRALADLILPWISAIGLAVAVGIAYFVAAQVSLAVLIKSNGLVMFWLAGGLSSGVLIALGPNARLPVIASVIVASLIAHLMNGRNVWFSTAFASCNVSQTLLAAWLIERHFGSPFNLDKLSNVLGLFAAAVVANAVSAVGAIVAYKLFHGPTVSIWAAGLHWFTSGAIGMITIAPLVIGLIDTFTRRTAPYRARKAPCR